MTKYSWLSTVGNLGYDPLDSAKGSVCTCQLPKLGHLCRRCKETVGFLSTLCVCLCQFELWWSLLTLNSLTSSCRGQKYLSTVAEECGAEWTFWGGLLRLCAEIWGPSQKTLSSRLTRAASVNVAFCLQDQKEITSRWMEFLRNQYASSPFPCLFLFVVSSLERLFHRNYAAEKEINGCVLVSFWSKKGRRILLHCFQMLKGGK